jgi:thiol:disulfide interchange protein DsbA
MYQRVSGWIFGAALALLAVVLPARAQLAVGRDYVPIVPVQTTDNPAKIEVIEFFSYGCPHCSEFHPVVGKWSATLPGRRGLQARAGHLRPSPVGESGQALLCAGSHRRSGQARWRRLRRPAQEREQALRRQSIIEWVAAQGVDAKKFADAYSSFGVVSKVKRADQMAQAYKIQGVPALAVDGKYLVPARRPRAFTDLVRLDRPGDRQGAQRARQEVTRRPARSDRATRRRQFIAGSGPSGHRPARSTSGVRCVQHRLLKVFITGASSGIGRALAEHYAAREHVLGLVARVGASCCRVLCALAGQVVCYPLDVTDAAAMRAAGEDFIARAAFLIS